MMHKDWYSLEEVPYCFSRSSVKFLCHTGWKISDLNQVWVRLLGWSQLSNPSDLPCLFSCKMIGQIQLSVSETHCDLDFLKLTQLLLLISLWGHWIQEIAKFNIHVKPLIKAALIIQSLWVCFLSMSVCECASDSVSVCNWFYKLIHGPQKQINVHPICAGIFLSGNLDFGLEKSWNIMELFFWDFCGNPEANSFTVKTIIWKSYVNVLGWFWCSEYQHMATIGVNTCSWNLLSKLITLGLLFVSSMNAPY